MGRRRFVGVCLCVLACLALPGCLYPGGDGGGRTAPGEYVALVQNAVETYRDMRGVLPIKNSTAETPIYEKYKVDFKKLLDSGLISRVPADAFEGGGRYEYVIIDPEGKMQVKLRDLAVAQQIADLQREVDSYRLREGVLPAGPELWPSVHQIDFDRLGIKRLQVPSVYSGVYLAVLLHESGRVFVDYGPDIAIAMRELGIKEADPDTDLRVFLTERSHFVPAASLPYRWKDGEPAIEAGGTW